MLRDLNDSWTFWFCFTTLMVFFTFLSPGIWFLAPWVLECYGIFKLFSMVGNHSAPKAVAPALIDGRTQEQWFEIIRMMGKEEFERLARPALDGLEDSTEGIGAWDVKALLGERYWTELRKEFYPEQFCDTCSRDDGHDRYCYEIQQEVARIKINRRALEFQKELKSPDNRHDESTQIANNKRPSNHPAYTYYGQTTYRIDGPDYYVIKNG